MLDSSVAIIYPNQLTGYLMDVSVPSSSGWKKVDLASPEDFAKCSLIVCASDLLLFGYQHPCFLVTSSAPRQRDIRTAQS
jgi:hypothetical protein